MENETPEVTPEQAAEEAAADFIYGKEPEDAEGQGVQEEAAEAEQEVEEEVEEQEAEEQEASEEEGDEIKYVEIEIDGVLYEVPESIQEGYLRQQDYTQKTQEVANQRREAEVMREELQVRQRDFDFANEVYPDLLRITQIEGQIEQTQNYLRENVEQLSPTDIEKIRIAIEDAGRERDQLAATVNQRQTEFQQAREQSLKEILEKSTEVLRQSIPDWGESQESQIREFALANGFTEQEFSSVVDAREKLVLWKALQYDALQAGKATAVRRVETAPVKPKSRNPMPKDVGNRLNLRKKLKSEKLSAAEKASLIGDDIAGRMFGN